MKYTVIAAALALTVSVAKADLILNEGFELGTTAITTSGLYTSTSSSLTGWNQWANSGPSVSTQQSTDNVIEGNYSAHIVGNLYSGLYQYNNLGPGTYTASGWFYVVSGSAVILEVGNGCCSQTVQFSPTTTQIGAWEYLSVTAMINESNLGPTLYTGDNGSNFYVDGFWLNRGATSTNPLDPTNGFNPNAPAVPEPGSLALLGFGLVGLAIGIKRRQGRVA